MGIKCSRDPERSNLCVTQIRLEPNISKTAGDAQFSNSLSRELWPMTDSVMST